MKQFYSRLLLTSCLSALMFFTGILSAHSQQFLTQINGMNAYVHLPDDYATTSASYPVIIFVTGLGEVGTDAKKLLLYGPSYFVNKGHKMQFTVNGKVEKPIIISLQSKTAWPRPDAFRKTYDSIMLRYRVDADRFYLTGLSMGGWSHNSFITYSQEYASRPAAIVSMSAPPANYSASNYKWFAQAGGKWWGLEGDADQRGNTKTRDTLNKYVEGSAKYTQYKGGHCCWNTYYDPNWTENGESIYTWLLKQRRGGAPQQNELPAASAGDSVAITLPGDSIVLAGSATDRDGTITKYEWSKVAGPAEPLIATPNQPQTIISADVAGSYQYQLKVTDNKGGVATDTVSVIVLADTTPAASGQTLPGRIEAESFDNMLGIQKAGTIDAGGGSCVGYVNKNDWFEYNVHVAQPGNFTARFRVSSLNTNGQFSILDKDGSVIATVKVPKTGANQTWTTVTTFISLKKGNQRLRIVANTEGAKNSSAWNINWMEFTLPTVTAANSSTASQFFTSEQPAAAKPEQMLQAAQPSSSLRMFPNPAVNSFSLAVSNTYTGAMKVQVLDMAGSVRKEFNLIKNQQVTRANLSIGELSGGTYFVRVQTGNHIQTEKMLKL